MNDVKSNVNPLIEIKEIYLEGVKSPGFYTKESIYRPIEEEKVFN